MGPFQSCCVAINTESNQSGGLVATHGPGMLGSPGEFACPQQDQPRPSVHIKATPSAVHLIYHLRTTVLTASLLTCSSSLAAVAVAGSKPDQQCIAATLLSACMQVLWWVLLPGAGASCVCWVSSSLPLPLPVDSLWRQPQHSSLRLAPTSVFLCQPHRHTWAQQR